MRDVPSAALSDSDTVSACSVVAISSSASALISLLVCEDISSAIDAVSTTSIADKIPVIIVYSTELTVFLPAARRYLEVVSRKEAL